MLTDLDLPFGRHGISGKYTLLKYGTVLSQPYITNETSH
jgi:hypothetical protein